MEVQHNFKNGPSLNKEGKGGFDSPVHHFSTLCRSLLGDTTSREKTFTGYSSQPYSRLSIRLGGFRLRFVLVSRRYHDRIERNLEREERHASPGLPH